MYRIYFILSQIALIVVFTISVAAQDWAVQHGDASGNSVRRLIEHNGFVYTAGSVYDSMFMAEVATFAKHDGQTGALIWQRQLTYPSVLNDLTIGRDKVSLYLVGRSDPFTPGTDGFSLVLKVDLNGNVLINRRFEQFDREEFSRIIVHPKPDNEEYHLYISGGRTFPGVGNEGRDQLGLWNVNEDLELNWHRYYTPPDGRELEAARGLVAINNGELLLLGNDIAWNNPNIPNNNGVVLQLDGDGIPLNAWSYPAGIDWYDAVVMTDTSIMLAGHRFVDGGALLMNVNLSAGGEPSWGGVFPDLGAIQDLSVLSPGSVSNGGIFYFTAPETRVAPGQNLIVGLDYSPRNNRFGYRVGDHLEPTTTTGFARLMANRNRLYFAETRLQSAGAPSDVLLRDVPANLIGDCLDTLAHPFVEFTVNPVPFVLEMNTGEDGFIDDELFAIDPGLPLLAACSVTDSCAGFSVNLSVEAECFSGTYTAVTSGGEQPFTYVWRPLSCPSAIAVTTTTPVLTYESPCLGRFDLELSVTDVSGCMAIDTVEYEENNELPEIKCPTEVIELVADPGQCYATHDAIFSVVDDCPAALDTFVRLCSD
ncbi:MAG: hypothetical protein AAFN92_10235, partial [Bacteroidota bacterium]